MDTLNAPVGSFTREYRFLSNFYPANVEYEGAYYPSVENAYQAAKCEHDTARDQFLACSASRAKLLGREIKVRSDWDEIKLKVMADLVQKKFQDRLLARKLVATGTRILIEGNWWGDTFWGVCRGEGENHLGKILMRVRDELEDQDEHTES